MVKNRIFQILLKADELKNCHGLNKPRIQSDYHPEKIYYANKNNQVKDVEHVSLYKEHNGKKGEDPVDEYVIFDTYFSSTIYVYDLN